MKKWAQVSLVIVGALIITALSIDAADTLTGKGGTLLSSVIGAPSGCGEGMISVQTVPGVSCVDLYEVSPSSHCPTLSPQSSLESHKNVETKECTAQSQAGIEPWVYVTRDQAAQLCARSGKRLPTSAEWYALASGMVDVERSCNVHGGHMLRTGELLDCVSPVGAYDFVGNVWEWVSDDVTDGQYNNRSLPQSGYVLQVDNTGIALETGQHEEELYGNDYFWSNSDGVYGVIRGGFYASGKDAGMYTAHMDTPTNAANAGIGFRCVR